MRQLRKTHMEYEERNAALQKHVESMRAAVERLEGDVMQERGRNSLLHQHLETLRQALTSSFCSLPLPGESGMSAAPQTHLGRLTNIATHEYCSGLLCLSAARLGVRLKPRTRTFNQIVSLQVSLWSPLHLNTV